MDEMFLSKLLTPDQWSENYDGSGESRKFKFPIDDIKALIEEATEVVKEQDILINIDTPVKVFGDIHGQYCDLMRFFWNFGFPNDQGEKADIDQYHYLFLGDYVDRG